MKTLQQISQYPVSEDKLESGNLLHVLEQTKFLVFWQNIIIPCVFPDRFFLKTIFPVFPVQWGP